MKEALREALRIGADVLDMEFASCCVIDAAEAEIYAQVSPPDTLRDGQRFALRGSLCELTLQSDDLVMFGGAASGQLSAAPVLPWAHPAAFLGVTVIPANAAWAVLCFWSARPRKHGFNLNDGEFARLVAGWVGSARAYAQHCDLLRQSKARLAEVTATAEAKAKGSMAFLAAISHEIRTPLNVIIGATGLMTRSYLPVEQKQFIAQITRAGQHLMDLTRDVLEIAKLESVTAVRQYDRVNVQSVLQEVVFLLRDQVDAKNLAVALEVCALPDMVWGDRTRLRQALLNYVANAVKFASQGTITFRALIEQETDAQLLLRFEVEDNGPGIDNQELATLFQDYRRLALGIKREVEGIGLGLAINKRLAKILGGTVGVRSVPGVGSTFWLTARFDKLSAIEEPLTDADADADADAEAQLDAQYAGARILLVEDDVESAELASELLGLSRLSVDIARTGEEAEAVAKGQAYDLILMDLSLPGFDGLEATRRIRQIEHHRQTPVLAMTGKAFKEERALCLAAGMNAFMAKPISPETLFAVILRCLDDAGRTASDTEQNRLSATKSQAQTRQRFSGEVHYKKGLTSPPPSPAADVLSTEI